MEQLKRAFKQFLSLFPSPLPVGVTEFGKFADDVYELTGPIADYDSIKFTLAGIIMHMGPQRSTAPKNYFVRSLRKTAANQIAHFVLTEIKNKHDEAAREAKLAAEKLALNVEENQEPPQA